MWDFSGLLSSLTATAAYSLLGIVMFGASFVLIRWAVPFSITKEIEEDQNTALAVLIGSVILGLSIIIAASISG